MKVYQIRAARWVVGVLTLAAVAVACSSTSAVDPNSEGGATTNPDDGGVAPTVKLTDGSVNDGDATSGCEELGALSATGLTASYDTNSRWFTGAVPKRSSLTELTVLGFGTPANLQGNIAALGTGLNANYATCTHCMIVLAGCTATDCNSAKKFFAESGSAYFNQVSAGPGQLFVGQFADVTFREVSLDANYTSTNVPNGACLHLTSFAFAAKTPASATDGGGSSDGGNTTGGWGRGSGAAGSKDPPVITSHGGGGPGDAGTDSGACQQLGYFCSVVDFPCCAPLSCVGEMGLVLGACQ